MGSPKDDSLSIHREDSSPPSGRWVWSMADSEGLYCTSKRHGILYSSLIDANFLQNNTFPTFELHCDPVLGAEVIFINI